MGRGLHLVWTSGVAPCSVFDRMDVDYRDDTVQVTLYEGADRNDREPVCTQIAIHKQTIVPLPERLPGREVVEGAAHRGLGG